MIKLITGYVILGVTVLLIGWDIYAFIHGGGEATISTIISRTSDGHPIIPFAFGLLMGHFFAT